MGRWTEALVVFVPCLVELVCTIFLVFLGCGSTLNWPQEETSPTVLTISLSFGFLYAFLGNISTLVSGGFFNPAITAALATIKTIPIKRAVCLIFAQLTGGEIDSLLATMAACEMRDQRLESIRLRLVFSLRIYSQRKPNHGGIRDLRSMLY